MSKIRAILVFLSFLISISSNGQSINRELSNLLFEVDISVLDTTLIDKFKKKPSLEYSKQIDTFIIYREPNPMYSFTYIFKFKINKYFKTQFLTGNLFLKTIDTSNTNVLSTVVSLRIKFLTESELETNYEYLISRFQQYGVVLRERLSNYFEESVIIDKIGNRKISFQKSVVSLNKRADFSLAIEISTTQ